MERPEAFATDEADALGNLALMLADDGDIERGGFQRESVDRAAAGAGAGGTGCCPAATCDRAELSRKLARPNRAKLRRSRPPKAPSRYVSGSTGRGPVRLCR
jgi:hypothetical protein